MAGDRMSDPSQIDRIDRESRDWPSLTLQGAELDQLELILTGALDPLAGYMAEGDSGPLSTRVPWPVPVRLEVSSARASGLRVREPAALRDPEGVLLAALHVTQVKPGERGDVWLAGPVTGVQLPARPGLERWRHMPQRVVEMAQDMGWSRTLALEVDGPVHRAEIEGLRALLERDPGAGLLVQYPAAPRSLTDPHHVVDLSCLELALSHLPAGRWILNVVPGGVPAGLLPIVHANHGATALVTGAGIEPAPGLPVVALGPLSGLPRVEIQARLERGEAVPPGASWPEVLEKLARLYPPLTERGFTVFFTGLSGAGKSTIAQRLIVRLMGHESRRVTLLDGDRVRLHLSSELTFSREHRDLNIRRIGFVAAEITRHGGIAVCAPIAPYQAVREEVRRMVEKEGGFFLVHVSTAIEVCEDRDRKGLYAKARAGLVKGFTGIDDPYEVPPHPDLALDTARLEPEAAVDRIVDLLTTRGYLSPQ